MRVAPLAVTLVLLAGGAKARSSKDWAQLDFDALELEWEGGDEEDELITDDELLYRETERRREAGIEVSDAMDAASVRHQQSMAGPAMMFVELRPAKPDGSAFGEDDYKWLAGSWREVRDHSPRQPNRRRRRRRRRRHHRRHRRRRRRRRWESAAPWRRQRDAQRAP